MKIVRLEGEFFKIWFGVTGAMWRALFFAFGSMTIFLGLQSLAFEQIQLAPGKGALQIVKRLLRDDGGSARSIAAAPGEVDSPAAGQVFRSASGSSFGPSRFTNGGFGGTTFSAAPYRDLTQNQNNGLAVRSGQSTSIPRVDLAGYQTRAEQASSQQSQFGSVAATPGRVIQSKDWMPWSLLAIGAVIVLYTRSFGVLAL